MLIRQFKRTDPLTIFLIIVILLTLWAGAFIKVKSQFSLYFDLSAMPLYNIVSVIIGTNPVPGIFFSLILVSLMAFLMVNLNTTLFFINERTFLPALVYIMLSGLLPQYQLLNPAIFAAVFLMLAIRKIMDSYRIQGIAYNFFDAGLLIGTGSLFYANLIWFGIIIVIGIALLRTVNAREIFLSVIGLATPFLIAAGIFYVSGNRVRDFIDLTVYNLFGKQSEFAFSPLIIAAALFACFLTIISISQVFIMINSKKIQARKTFSLLLWVFFVSVAVYFLVPSVSVEIMWIAGIPMSYYITHYFLFVKSKVIPDILFGLFFLLILIIQGWSL